MTKISALLLAITFLILVTGVTAQAPNISGRVEDSAKAPVAGAAVILKNKFTGAERTAVTDEQGRFLFEAAADRANTILSSPPTDLAERSSRRARLTVSLC